VKANKGSAGIDRMTVDGIADYLKQHWPAIREQLLRGTYQPKPVRRVEIAKPDGGVRKLGIPTVIANCTVPQFTFGMGGDPPSISSASRAAL
jgi:RNA-directed DNA polymerase